MSLAARAAALLGRAVLRATPLAGGDLAAVLRLELADGEVAVAKSGPDPRAEARMLGAIAAAGVPTPQVLAADEAVLVLEALPGDERLGTAWASIGAAIRRLHDATGEGYGWPEDYAFATVPIANAVTADWPAFWAERRLLACAPHVPAAIARRVDRLARDLPARLPTAPRPALLHGDLWSGNILAAGGRFTGLIDPACAYGHAEADLAMLTLFDRPAAAFWSGYGAPEPGRDERRPIYQLWPALVHLRLFGSGYFPMVARLLDAAGA